MDFLNIHDFVELGGNSAILLVAVLILRRDMKWFMKSFDDHEKLDDQRFGRIDQDIRDIRREVR